MIIYFEPAAMCTLQSDLVLAPLPAKKQLWEATDEVAWKAESQGQTSFALAADGGLVKLDEGQMHCSNGVYQYKSLDSRTPTSAAWEEWCSGMDGFGGLVMLAVSLIG